MNAEDVINPELRTCQICAETGPVVVGVCLHCQLKVCRDCWIKHSAQHRTPVRNCRGEAMYKPAKARPKTKEEKAAAKARAAAVAGGQLGLFEERR